MSSSKILFFLCLSFVVGIFLESVVKIPQIIICGFLILGVVITLAKKIFPAARPLHWGFPSPRKNLFGSLLGFCLLVFTLGILRVQISEFNIANDKLSKFNGKNQVILTGVVSDEPDVRDTNQKLKIEIPNFKSTILVTTKTYPEYKYLDQVKITGKLEEPDPGGTPTDSFNYKNYLLKDHIYSVMNFPSIEVTGRSKASLTSAIYSGILFLKQKLNQSIQNISLPPHSLILEGILLGNNKNITPDLRDKLSKTNLRFLTAISGLHVLILSVILVSFLTLLGFGRIPAGWLSLILVWLYIALTGFSASGIRAGIMGSIFILAGILGRQNASFRTIAFAASLMLLQNPLLLVYDIGFQLSFLASLGIIHLKPVIAYFFKLNILDILAATLAAQIFTLPIMVYGFGQLSFVSPITSILILPIMPLILGFGFAFSIIGIFSKFLGWIVYLPCWFLITYFLKVLDLFSQPWMVKTMPNVSWIWVVVSYLVIGGATWFLKKKYIQNFV